MKTWSKADIRYLIEHYETMKNLQIAINLGKSRHSVEQKAFVLGLKKPREFFAEISRTSENCVACQFKKGNVPHNKGVKGYVTNDEKKIERMKATQFKKGHKPENWRPTGSERVNNDGYIEVKTREPNVWELKHRVVWLEHKGEIPKGVNIQFRDGNKRNFDIDNLYAIDRKNQMKQNSYRNYGEEYARLVQLQGAVKRQINKLKR